MAGLIGERIAGAHGWDPLRFIGRTGEQHALRGAARSAHGRGVEIQHWLEVNTPDPLACCVAILDDDADMGALLPAHVATSWLTGLLDAHVAKARALLSVPLADVWGFEGWLLDTAACDVRGGDCGGVRCARR
jgi:hypothetical protein